MKFDKNRKYFSIAVYSFLVIAASMILFFILLFPSKPVKAINEIISILSPVIIGFLIAFILNPMLNFFEKKVFAKLWKKKKLSRRRRTLSLIATYIIFLGILTFFVILIVPSLINSITDLINNIEGYYKSGMAFIEKALLKYNISDDFLAPFNDLGSKLVGFALDLMNSLLPKLYGIAVSATSVIAKAVIGFAFSIYMLYSKEIFAAQFTKVIKTFTKEKTQHRIMRVASLSYETFTKYISGYLVDSAIVGIICYIVMLIFGWPYPALISIIIGISNMIPFFGPFIGGIPSVLLIFLVSPWEALFFTIFIIVLQQIDANFLCPKILGQRVGLSSFWVMFAIVTGGSIFGIMGMLLSVPTFAVIYSIARTFLERKKCEKQMQTENLQFSVDKSVSEFENK